MKASLFEWSMLALAAAVFLMFALNKMGNPCSYSNDPIGCLVKVQGYIQ